MATRWQRPTVDTKLHIDMTWWEENNRDIRVYIRELLCDECRAECLDYQDQQYVDAIDDQTGEVHRVDGLWHCLRTCCGSKPGYIAPDAPIVDAAFRTFLANGNEPLSPRELHASLGHPSPSMLLQVFTRGPVYMGIRPVR